MHGTFSTTASGPKRIGDRLRFAGLLIVGIGVYVVCLKTAQVDFGKLWVGLPRLANWAARSWPPDVTELATDRKSVV